MSGAAVIQENRDSSDRRVGLLERPTRVAKASSSDGFGGGTLEFTRATTNDFRCPVDIGVGVPLRGLELLLADGSRLLVLPVRQSAASKRQATDTDDHGQFHVDCW